jgi:hypothetical protein
MTQRFVQLTTALVLAAAALSPAWAADAKPPAAVAAAMPAVKATAVPAAAPASTPAAAPNAAPAPAPAASGAAAPAAAASAPDAATLDGRVQDIKGDVIKLNRDLLVLEEELLFPANTQVALFVSLDVGALFELESVQIKLDDKIVATHLYTPQEVKALHRGGVQRIHVGNLRAGEHSIDAFFTGQGPHTRDYKRATTLKFEKGTDPKYIELRIKDSTAKLQPEFEVKVWQ